VVLFVKIVLSIVKRINSKSPKYNSSSSSTQASSNQPNNQPPVSPITADNPSYTQAFNQAVATAQAGNKVDAYRQLKSLQKDNPKDINLLLWLAFTTQYLAEARMLVTIAKFMDRDNASVIQAEEWLARQEGLIK
jgi:hypothetical protein